MCVLTASLAGGGLFSASARAEFFGCNDKNSVRYISGNSTGHLAHSSAFASANARSTYELLAQSKRPRVTIYPRRKYASRNSVRQCRATLVKEYRLSGTVIVPRMQCWWE
jgi:hypothetical protein